MTYSDQLKDPRWFAFKEKVYKHYENCGCHGCGDYDREGTHEIHHVRYISGRMAWEYDIKDVIPLCRGCHQGFHDNKKRLEEILSNHRLLYTTDFKVILDKLERCIDSETNKYGTF